MGKNKLFKAYADPHSLDLKCWRASCEASGNPVPLEDWLQQLPSEVQEKLDWIRPRDVSEMELWAQSALPDNPSDDDLIVFSAPPGAGKTSYIIKKLAQDAQDGRAGTLLMQSYKGANEKAEAIRAHIEQEGLDVEVLVAVSMTCSCVFKDKLGVWNRFIPSWGVVMCGSCEERSQCPAHNQFRGVDRKGTVVVAVHAYLPELERRNRLGTYVVIDENCSSIERERVWTQGDLRAFLKHHTPWHRERHPAARRLLNALGVGLGEILHKDLHKRKGPKYTRLLYGEELRSILVGLAGEGQDPFVYDRSIPRPGVHTMQVLQEDPEGLCLQDFDDLVDGITEAAIRVGGTVGPGGEYLLFDLRLPRADVPVYLLDATAKYSWETLKRYFPERNLIYREFFVRDRGHEERIHYVTSSYTMRRINRARGRVARSLRQDLGRALDLAKTRILGRQPWMGIICPKKIEKTVKGVISSLGLRDVLVDHYGNIRGTNAFEEVELLLLFGDLIPNLEAEAYKAYVLGVNARERIWGIRCSEAIQAAGRGRGARRRADNPVMVVHFTQHWTLSETPPSEVYQVQIGRPVEEPSLEEIIKELLDCIGYVTPQMLNANSRLLDALRDSGVGGDRGHWLLSYLSCQLCPQFTPTRGDDKSTPRRRLRRAVEKVAVMHEAVLLKDIKIPGERGRFSVYEGRPGAWSKWFDAQTWEDTPDPTSNSGDCNASAI